MLRERQADGSTWHPFGLEEMIPNMDGWEYLSPHDMNDSGVIIGTGWFTDPANPQAEGEVHGCALVPVGFRARDPYTDNSGTQIEPINQGFDPRVTKENPWPWASVVKGGVSNVVKLVLPGNAAQMRLVVKAQGSGPAEVQVKEHGAQEPPAQELAGLKDGDNLIELIGLMGSNEVTEASVEVHLSEAQGADTGEVVAKLNVMALPPRTVSVGIYRVGDDRPLQGSTEPRAKLPLTPANEEIRTELNNLFAQAGISFTISAESKPIPNVAFDDNSNGAVDGPELDTIEAAAESVTAPLRVVLADKKGLKSTGELFPRGVNLDAPGACLVFVRDSGEHTATIAGHELGHILNLSFYTRDSEMHDPGPFPSGTEGLMQPGRGVDHPEMGRWLGHDDWRVANETAKTKFK